MNPAFLMVNETLNAVRYRQAILRRAAPVHRIVAVSGVASPDPHSLFGGFCEPSLRWSSRTAISMRSKSSRPAT